MQEGSVGGCAEVWDTVAGVPRSLCLICPASPLPSLYTLVPCLDFCTECFEEENGTACTACSFGFVLNTEESICEVSRLFTEVQLIGKFLNTIRNRAFSSYEQCLAMPWLKVSSFVLQSWSLYITSCLAK